MWWEEDSLNGKVFDGTLEEGRGATAACEPVLRVGLVWPRWLLDILPPAVLVVVVVGGPTETSRMVTRCFILREGGEDRVMGRMITN